MAGNMDAVLKQQQATHQSMLDAVAKFNSARDEMDTLRKTTGAILSQHGVDDKGKPADSAPKYVHDLYNSINKEGGLSNISRSQMVAGIQAYQTGVGVEQQQLQLKGSRLQIEGAENANRHNRIATDMAQMQLDAAKRQLEEQARIREAQKATKEDVEKLSKTKTVTTEKITEYQLRDGTKVKIPTEELSPLLERINNEKSEDKKLEIKKEIEKLLYKYSPESVEFVDQEIDDGSDSQDRNYRTVKNPDFKEFVSAYDKTPRTVKADASGAPILKPSSVNRAALEGFIQSEIGKYQQVQRQTEEKRALDLDVAKFNVGQETDWANADKEILGAGGETHRKMRERLGLSTATYNDPKLQDLQSKIDTITATINFITPDAVAEKVPERKKLETRQRIAQLKQQRDSLTKQLEEGFAKNKAVLEKAQAPVKPYEAGEFGYTQEKYDPVTEKVVTEVKKDLYEQTDDEFAILSNWMKANGGVPETFTKEAYYASKGISRPIVMDIGGGQMYAKIGGKEAFLENKAVGQSALSITDQKALYQAKELATARDLSAFQTNGFRFSGQIRVGDIDQANKVKLELGTTTRALANVDRLIRIAEDASLYDKLMPAEVSGIAQALTNAAQSANRTEIGGSGAWSNQDQAYMDKIIRDPSAGFNAIFTKQTIASLKEYRSRLASGLADKGAVYGFRYEQSGGMGGQGIDTGMQKLRVAYPQLMASGNYTPQEALAIARQNLEANYE